MVKELTLRTWHRRTGAGLGVLLALQALTGLWMSAETVLAALGWLEPSFHAHSPYILSLRLHHGGGTVGAVYRLALAGATLWMAVSGLWIFGRVLARRRRSAVPG
jgi:hypothetical protein